MATFKLIAIIVIMTIIIVAGIVLFIKQALKNGKVLQEKEVEILREKLLKQEVIDLIIHDEVVEVIVNEKIKRISNASPDELIAMGNIMFDNPSYGRGKE